MNTTTRTKAKQCMTKGMLVLAVCFSSGAIASNDIDQGIATTKSSHQNNQQVQKQIDVLALDTQQAAQLYQQNQHQADLIEAYNRQLEKMVTSQQAELDDIAQQLVSLDSTQQAALPLLIEMKQALAGFIASDLPFLQAERAQRLTRLDTVFDRADVSLAEKYRQLLEAYQIEIEYGRTIEAYEGSLQQSGQSERQVNFFRLGRSALYYQTLDGQTSALWQPEQQSWLPLSSDYNLELRSAIRIAWQQQVPALLALPLNPVEGK
ncbi:DUF3450 domain-containing protein [Motilimonas pumila]|uniref:DUF3450 domain-containing protein n=1 Tax=Motilimonas pumila TaxID=2303987 RepID=A0A418YEK0_9GAMM|nr:DUF3450 domain-containing protein [Motilimonas pumila]RJG47502.1 DUF3450 domain-containing protein [Motilimonas pumila]